MIHKFTSNDNKGNVNTVEVGSTYTKLGRVAPPVEDTDAANKAYVDSVAGGSSGGGVLVVHEDENNGTLDKTAAEIFTALENNTVVIKMEGELDGEGKPYISIQVMVDAHVFGNDYYFGAFLGQRYISYSASSGTDYPTEQH